MTKKIILAEKDNYLASVLSYIFAKRGYYIFNFTNEDAVLKKLASDKIDLVITSINLSAGCGLELTRKIKSNANTKRTNVIVTSYEGDKETIIKTLKLGANDFLVKPFTLDEFLKKTDTHLSNKTDFVIRTIKDFHIFYLEGEFESEYANKLKTKSWEILSKGGRKIVFDLTKVKFLDHKLLVFLCSLLSNLQSKNGKVIICGANTKIYKLFEKAGINNVFPMYSTCAEAIRN